MGYAIEDDMVRVDFFKQSGKWYATEAIKWIGYEGDIFEEFAESLRLHHGNKYTDMDAVCLHPYNKFEHPIMLRQGSWAK